MWINAQHRNARSLGDPDSMLDHLLAGSHFRCATPIGKVGQGASAVEVTGKHDQPQRVDSAYQPCAIASIATPELG